MNILIKNKLNNEKGAAALLMIVIIGVASLLMATSASNLGLGELEMGLNENKGAEVFSLADGCGEESLHRLRKNSSYVGGTVNISTGSCIITVSGSGTTRVIDSSATVGLYTKKIEMTISMINNVVSVTSWNEVSQ